MQQQPINTHATMMTNSTTTATVNPTIRAMGTVEAAAGKKKIHKLQFR